MRRVVLLGSLYTLMVISFGVLAGIFLEDGRPTTGMPPGIYRVSYYEEFFARGTHQEFYYVVARPMKVVHASPGMDVLQPIGDMKFYIVDPRMVKDPRNKVTLVLDPRIPSSSDE